MDEPVLLTTLTRRAASSRSAAAVARRSVSVLDGCLAGVGVEVSSGSAPSVGSPAGPRSIPNRSSSLRSCAFGVTRTQKSRPQHRGHVQTCARRTMRQRDAASVVASRLCRCSGRAVQKDRAAGGAQPPVPGHADEQVGVTGEHEPAASTLERARRPLGRGAEDVKLRWVRHRTLSGRSCLCARRTRPPEGRRRWHRR